MSQKQTLQSFSFDAMFDLVFFTHLAIFSHFDEHALSERNGVMGSKSVLYNNLCITFGT